MHPSGHSMNKMPLRARPSFLSQSIVAAIESLENRRFLSALPPNVGLPFTLEFDRSVTGVRDRDGTGTGFQRTQGNRLGTESQPQRIDIRPTSGILEVQTIGSRTTGGPFQADNTLSNGLQSLFDARTRFTVSTRIQGPLTQFETPGREAGIYIGQTHDRFVSLTIAGTADGPRIRFYAEGTLATEFILPRGPLGQRAAVSGLSSVSRLDLMLIARPTDGTIDAYYGFGGESLRRVGSTLRLDNDLRGQIFRNQQRAGVIAFNRSTSNQVRIRFDRFAIGNTEPDNVRPEILGSTPANGATGVARDAGIVLQVRIFGDGVGVDGATLTGATRIVRVSDNNVITGTANTSGGGDTFVFTPSQILQANTQYRFEVGSTARDTAGNAFLPFTTTFRTGTTTNQNFSINWEQLSSGSWTTDRRFSHVAIGPDNRFYASDLDGFIYRASINADGTLASPTIIDTIRDNNGGVARFISGFAFDPRSTNNNVTLWVNHTEFNQDNTSTGTNFTSRLSRLSGSVLQTYADALVNLPRSTRDHVPGVPVFGPDGNLYFGIGSMSSEGASDAIWANRNESLLTAAIVRLDISDIETRMLSAGALDVRTIDVGGSYDPFASNAPLTLYATGIRNAFQVYWSDGRLYAAGNRSGTGGNTPGTPVDINSNPVRNRRIDFDTDGPYNGGTIPALSGINNAANTPDPLIVVQEGRYYGHPNPSRAEYVAYGGNPTSGVDPNEVPQYPVGTQPDRNFAVQALDFTVSTSPNATIRYQNTDAFGGQLAGKLIVGRFSSGKDLVAVTLDGSGNPTGFQSITPRSFNFDGPLSVVENPANGNLYVVDMRRESSDPDLQFRGRIWLLRPISSPGLVAASVRTTPASVSPASVAPTFTVSSRQLSFTDVAGSSESRTQQITVTNSGRSSISLAGSAVRLTGSNASNFRIVSRSASIAAGRTGRIIIAFDAPVGASTNGIQTATLVVRPSGASSNTNIQLRGLPTAGTRGTNEPSLQRLFDLFNINVRAGDAEPSTTPLNPGGTSNAISAPRFEKSGSAPITVQPLTSFTEGTNGTSSILGYYRPGTPERTTEFLRFSQNDEQTASPIAVGATSFDPGSTAFALSAKFPRFTNTDGSSRVVFGEDSLNTWEPNTSERNKVRVYPLRDASGRVAANSYIVAFEAFTQIPGDYQDAVYILRGVKLAASGSFLSAVSTEASVNAPVDPSRLVFNRVQNPNLEFGNIVRDTNTLQLRNTGSTSLRVSGISISSGAPFAVVGSSSFTINSGQTRNISVRFTAQSGPELREGTLSIRSNASNGSTLNVPLAGLWQNWSEDNPNTGITVEPSAASIVRAFGLATRLTNASQSLNTGGATTAVGEEVLSPFWRVADTSQPVTVRAIATYRQVNLPGTLRWYPRNDATTFTNILSGNNIAAQSVLPNSQTDPSSPAQAIFSPSSDEFGFRVENIFSDPAETGRFFGVDRDLHQFRFYPARDSSGVTQPNSWVVLMDNFSEEFVNYDFQDAVYLIQNISPADLPQTPRLLSGVEQGGRNRLTWAGDSNVANYDVLRGRTATGSFTRVANGITSTTFNDSTIDGTWFYQVIARDSRGRVGTAAIVSV